MESRLCPLGFGDINVSLGSHIAAFYRNRQEQHAITIPFISTGLKRGARCIYAVEEETRDSLAGALQGAGVNTISALASGQLTILTADEAYLSGGCFKPDRMLDFWKASLEIAMKKGYQEIRITGELSWILQKRPGVERLMEYEARLNKVLAGYPQITLCQYNIARISGDIVLDALKTHPDCILGGVIIHNHFFVSPDDFLKQLRQQPRLTQA